MEHVTVPPAPKDRGSRIKHPKGQKPLQRSARDWNGRGFALRDTTSFLRSELLADAFEARLKRKAGSFREAPVSPNHHIRH